MLDSSEKPRMDGGAMQAIPMWSLSLGPARLCAPSCEHLFLPSQWWSEPLKQTDCGSNGMSHCKLDSHIWGQEMPHSNLLQEDMDMYDYHSTCCNLFAFISERGKNRKTTQSTLIIIRPQHFLKSGRSPETPGKLCDASILAHSSTNAWSFSSEEAIRKLYHMPYHYPGNQPG